LGGSFLPIGLLILGCEYQVPEAILDFIQAGIKVWMITGDKLETAKNIGTRCPVIGRFLPSSV